MGQCKSGLIRKPLDMKGLLQAILFHPGINEIFLRFTNVQDIVSMMQSNNSLGYCLTRNIVYLEAELKHVAFCISSKKIFSRLRELIILDDGCNRHRYTLSLKHTQFPTLQAVDTGFSQIENIDIQIPNLSSFIMTNFPLYSTLLVSPGLRKFIVRNAIGATQARILLETQQQLEDIYIDVLPLPWKKEILHFHHSTLRRITCKINYHSPCVILKIDCLEWLEELTLKSVSCLISSQPVISALRYLCLLLPNGNKEIIGLTKFPFLNYFQAHKMDEYALRIYIECLKNKDPILYNIKSLTNSIARLECFNVFYCSSCPSINFLFIQRIENSPLCKIFVRNLPNLQVLETKWIGEGVTLNLQSPCLHKLIYEISNLNCTYYLQQLLSTNPTINTLEITVYNAQIWNDLPSCIFNKIKDLRFHVGYEAGRMYIADFTSLQSLNFQILKTTQRGDIGLKLTRLPFLQILNLEALGYVQCSLIVDNVPLLKKITSKGIHNSNIFARFIQNPIPISNET